MSKTNQPLPQKEIIVRRAKVKDNLSRDRMAIKIGDFIGEDTALDSAAYQWVTRCSRTEVLPGFDLPTPDEPGQAIWDKFLAYLEMDADMFDEWERLVNAANEPINRKFAPPDNLTEDEKKDSPPSESSGEAVSATG